MKTKLITLLTLLLTVCSGAWATEETISLVSYTVADGVATLTSTSEKVTVVLSRNGGNVDNPASSNRGLRWQKTRVITVTLASGYKINSVQLTSGKNANSQASIQYTLTDGTDALSGSWDYAPNNSSKQDAYTWTAAENTTYGTWVLTNSGTTGDLYISAVTVNYEISASATEPIVTTQPKSATYESSDTPVALSVAALASGGDLSYQWYSNTTASNEGGTAISGETNASYTPSTATVGTYYYYCVVADDNGSATSNVATITVVKTIAPVISYASNTVTITCEGAGTIYYTTDNSEPTSSSTEYTIPFELTNTSTVRAVAIKGGNASEIVFANCKIDHSATALAVIGFGDGTQTSGTWTSNDGNYTLTSSNESDIQYYTIFSGSDGFKINATNNYVLKVSDNIKVTSIKFVGKSRGDASYDATIALEGFTPTLGTIEMGTFVKTIEFTPESALGYGATINITTGGNQFGGYFEIYGEEYTKSTVIYTETVWDFTNWGSETKSGVLTDDTNWNQTETSSGGNNFGTEGGRAYKNALSSEELQYNSTAIAETKGLSFTANAYGLAVLFDFDNTSLGEYHGGSYIWLYGSSSKITIPNVTAGSVIEIGVESHKDSEARGVTLNNCTQTQGDATSKVYQVCKWTVNTAGSITITPTKGLHIYYIKLQKAADAVTFTPAYDKTTYVTTKILDFTGVDGLKAYVATSAKTAGVTMTEVTAAVPENTPLLLVGTAGTEYTVPAAASATAPETNLLKAGDGTTVFDGSTYDYILFSDGKFYQIGSGTVATNKAYLHLDSAPSGARSLEIIFDDETTGVNEELGMKNEDFATAPVYNLNGQRVAQPTKGLYIVNGKKVVLK